MDRYQSTLKRKVRMAGIGLHSGRVVNLEIIPAPANTGIVFERTDLPGSAPIPAQAAYITSTDLCTTLAHGGASIATIEHLMAAFAGLGVDNAVVRVSAAEIPIMDGSAAPFVEKVLQAGLCRVGGFRKFFVIKDVFEVRDGDRWMRAEPDDQLRFSCHIDFNRSTAIGQQTIDFTFTQSDFLELSAARTFCHINEVDAMRAAGLALGGSLDNAIVVTDNGVVNPDGLRSTDEFVRHKLLDCIGDLGLLGAPLVGKITLSKAGHGLHALFMKELLKRKAELITVVESGSFRDHNVEFVEELAL